MSSLTRTIAVAGMLAAALLGGTPAAQADPAVALRITLSGTTPDVSATTNQDGAVAAVTGAIDGVPVDTSGCTVSTNPAAVSHAGSTAQVSGCTGTDLTIGLAPGGDGGGTVTASVRFGPRPGDCVLLCTWRFDVSSGWYLDCLFGGSF